MPSRKITVFSLLLAAFVLANLAGTRAHTAMAAPLVSLPVSDDYGYTAAAGVSIPLSVCDDPESELIAFPEETYEGFSNAVAIPFTFPFYELGYVNLYANINGLISLTPTSSEPYDHLPMPLDLLPNNLIAPFWTDLILATDGDMKVGQVCANSYTEETSQVQYFALEWDQVELNSGSEPFTFQALLFENGDIQFQYALDVPDVSAVSVGIEDSEGIFGLQAFYNEAGITPGSAIRITYPTEHPFGRLQPTFASGFLIQEQAQIEFTLRNISAENRLYDLAVSNEPASTCNWNTPGWEILFFRDNVQLTSSNGNNCPDLTIDGYNTAIITARVRALEPVEVGDFEIFTLTALAGSSDPAPVSMTLQAAVPAGFAQAYVGYFGEVLNMRLQLTWEKELIQTIPGDYFSGKNLAVTQIGTGGYFYGWERYYTGGSQLLATILNSRGQPISVEKFGFMLTNGSSDEDLTIASTPNGNVAVGWVRDRFVPDKTPQLLANFYTPSGDIIKEAQQIEFNGSFTSPRLAADVNNHFFLTWMQSGIGGQSDIYMAVFNSSGDVIKPAFKVTNSETTGESYFSPALTHLANGGVLLAYSVNTGTEQPMAYQVFSTDGALVQTQTEINYPNPRSRGKDLVQLSGGNVLISWIDENSHHVHYALLANSGSGWTSSSVFELAPNYQLGAINVSVTFDKFDHGIITWAEELGNRTLSYALINPAGDLLTPPMVFLRGTGLDTNAAGQGNAPFDGRYFLSLPVLFR